MHHQREPGAAYPRDPRARRLINGSARGHSPGTGRALESYRRCSAAQARARARTARVPDDVDARASYTIDDEFEFTAVEVEADLLTNLVDSRSSALPTVGGEQSCISSSSHCSRWPWKANSHWIHPAHCRSGRGIGFEFCRRALGRWRACARLHQELEHASTVGALPSSTAGPVHHWRWRCASSLRLLCARHPPRGGLAHRCRASATPRDHCVPRRQRSAHRATSTRPADVGFSPTLCAGGRGSAH